MQFAIGLRVREVLVTSRNFNDTQYVPRHINCSTFAEEPLMHYWSKPMIRSSILVISLLLTLYTVACDKAPGRLRQGETVQSPDDDKSAGTDSD